MGYYTLNVQVANSSETLVTTELRGVTSEKPAVLGKLILREEKISDQ